MATAGGFMAVLNCPSCSYFRHMLKPANPTLLVLSLHVSSAGNHRRNICCSAVQESSTPTAAAETKEKKDVKKVKEDPTSVDADVDVAKPKPAAKAPVKPLPQMMEEDVIPTLKTKLEAQEDVYELDIVFAENKLEGSFVKKGIPYIFWAFFPDGTVNGPKGFSISSYGSEVSTVEPFLVDEKKPTAKHVIFWVEKRLAAQGIIPVWQED